MSSCFSLSFLSLAPLPLLFLLVLLLTTLPTSIDARQDGADAAACDDQDPRNKLDSDHTGNLQNNNSPFTVNIASGANPNDGDPISITIETTSGSGFKGFLISVLPSSQVTLGSGYNGKRLGSWSSPSSSSLVQPRCQQNGIISALTHTSSSFKKTLPLIWTPPPAGTTLPNITILTTFVVSTGEAYIVTTPFAITPTGPSQPSLPLNPHAIAATNTSLTISWTPPRRAGSQPITNYIIQIDAGSESADTSQHIITPPIRSIDTQNTNTTYTITGLISGYTYRTQVAANNGVPGETLFTDLFAARVLRNTIRPPGIITMTIPISTITSTSAIIVWTTPDLAGETLVSYELQRAINGDLENVKSIYKGTNLNFTDTNLIANTTYQYRIITTTLAGSTASPYTSMTSKTCPNNCSGKGICGGDGRCICQNGIMGSDCSLNANTLCMGNNRMCMQWAVSTIESYVYVRLIGPSKTWFGVILDPDEIDGMKEGDAWIANIGQDTFNPTVADMYSSGRVDPDGDARESDLEWMTSTSRANKTAIAFTFRRKLDTGDAQDRVIAKNAGTKMRLSWGIGAELNLKQHKRGDYGKAHIDWAAGTAYELDHSLKYASFYLPIIIGLGVVIITGLFLQFPFIYRSIAGRFLLRSRVPPPWIASTPVDKLTLDVRPSLLTLSFGELGVVITYIICVAAMIGYGYKQMIDINRDGRYIWGHVTAVHIALTWLPLTKHSVWLYVFGISFERAIRFHRWIARMTVIMMYIHLGTMIVIWGGSIISSTDSTYGGDGVIYGFIAFLVFQSIILLSIEPIRRYAYEWFLYPHMILTKVATVFAMIHSTYLRWYMLVPLILYGWDYTIRYLNAFRYTSSIESLIHMSGTSPITDAPHEDKIEPGVTVLKVKVPPSFRYHGGDYVYMNIPIISSIQWHPFSISSYPTSTSSTDEEILTFHILDMGTGTYTNDIAKLGSKSFQPGSIQCKIDGPYGSLMIPVYEYSHLILVAGGVGATPMISILGSLFSAYKSGQLSHLHSCDVIWISRSSHALQTWWKELFTSIIAHGHPFRLHLYCTTQDPKHRPLIHIRPSREHNEITATRDASAAAVAVVVDEDGTSSTRMDENNGIKTAPPSPPFVSTPPSDASAVANLPNFHHDDTEKDIPITAGRPNLPQLIREIHTSRNGQSSPSTVPNKWGVLACGPPALMTTTRQLAYQLNCDWHEETFII